jgi:hypothetical protein
MILLLHLSLSVLAQSQSMAAETARVLPKGIFRARVVTVQTSSMNDMVNDNGELEPLGQRLNRTVTVDDVIASDPRVQQLVNTLNTLEAGLGYNLMAANLSNPVEMSYTTVMPALEYGLTNRLSFGIRLPIVRREVDVQFRSDAVNNALYAAGQVGGLSSQLTSALGEFGNQTFDSGMFMRQIFTSRGYDTPESFSRTEIGDLEFGGKYNFYKSDLAHLTTQLGFRAPTGSAPSLTNIYDKGSGNGAWATAVSFFEEIDPIPQVRFAAAQKVTYHFQDTRERAVPLYEQDGLPSLRPQDGQVQDVTRYQGVKFENELSSTVFFAKRAVSVWGAYQYMAKGRDEYTGPNSDYLYYEGLSDNSDLTSHAVEVGAGYSTIGAYRRKEFAVPGEIQLLYNTVVAGRNVPLLEYTRIDIMAYF